MKIEGLTALVTGANRGLGRAFVQALRDAGCSKIYAAARTIEGAACDAVVEPVQLDITKIGQVSSAATRCHDVSILINNAGVARFVPALGAPTWMTRGWRSRLIISARSPCAARLLRY
jgi:NAD(P)-dependent dehydrogenase (short-subunit alcohol dehydrogenase family)